MIEVSNLQKRFNDFWALRGLTFEIKKGEVLGFLGPNGAGKTTTMRILTGYLSATSGRVLINNHDVFDDINYVKQLIGYLPEDNPLYPEMKVYEYLEFLKSLRKLPKAKESRIREIILTCGLKEVYTRYIGELSKGYRQRVGLAGCLLHDPQILILDEPTNGLDPNQIVEIRNLIKELGKNKTVILSTHILPEVQATCQRMIIINEGKIVARGTVSQLTKSAGGKNLIEAEFIGPAETVKRNLLKITGVISVKIMKNDKSCRMEIEFSHNKDIREAIFKTCVKNHWIILELTPKLLSLEDVFKKLTTKE